MALTTAAWLLSWPHPAHSLGLGEIKVKSPFSKNFMAVIPVFMEPGESNFTAEIGKQADYNLLQVGRPPFIDSLAIAVENNPDRANDKIIVIRSKDPISLPSFNLVIRASTGGGSILENYFLAVDFRKSLSLELPKPEEEARAEEKKPEPKETAAPVASLPPAKPPVPVPAPVEQATVIPPASVPAPQTAVAAPQPKQAPTPVAPLAVRKKIEAPPPSHAPAAQTPAPPKAPEVEPIAVKPVPVATVKEEPVHKEEAVAPAVAEQPTAIIRANPSPDTNALPVVKGDSLYSLARRLNPEKDDLVRVVVALYLANKEAFIRENIHLLRSDATLSYNRVNEISAALSPARARDILSRDWSDPANPESGQAAVSAAFNVPLQRPVSEREVMEFLDRWRKHWMEKSAEIEGDYSDRFQGSRGARKKEWLARRQAFNDANDNLRITIGDVRIVRAGISLNVGFTQRVESDQASSLGQKTLTLQTENGELKVFDERFRVIKFYDFSHIWTVGISTMQSRPVAQGLINALAVRGHNAYETGGFAGNGAYRVAVGRFGTRMAAQALAENLTAIGETGASVLKLPFSIRIIMVENQAQAGEAAAQIVNAGYSPMMVETHREGKVWWTIFIGAFGQRHEAEKAMEGLKLPGFTPQVVVP